MNNKFIKSIFSIMTIGIISKFIGFVKQIVIAHYYGANIDTDIYFLSSGFVGNLSYLICSTLSITLLTMYIAEKQKANQRTLNEFISSVVFVFELLSVGVSILFTIFAESVIAILAPTYNEIEMEQAALFFRILLILISIKIYLTINGTILNAEKHFLPSQLNSIILSGTMILCVVMLQKKLNLYALIIGEILACLIQTIYLRTKTKNYYSLKKFSVRKQRATFKLIRLLLPLLFSYGAIEINQMVDKIITTGLGEGVLSSLSYGQLLNSAIITIFVTSFVTVFYTYLVEEGERGGKKTAMLLLRKNIVLITIILIPLSIWIICFSSEITTIVYGHGRFDQEAIYNTSLVQIGYCVGLCALGIRELLVRAHYAFQDTRKPTVVSIISIGLNIIGSIVLSRIFGVFGVTLASSISVLISVILLSFTLKSHDINIRNVYNIKELIKVFLSAVVSLLVILVIRDVVNQTILRVVLSTVISAIVYTVMVYTLKVEEIYLLVDIVKSKIRK